MTQDNQTLDVVLDEEFRNWKEKSIRGQIKILELSWSYETFSEVDWQSLYLNNFWSQLPNGISRQMVIDTGRLDKNIGEDRLEGLNSIWSSQIAVETKRREIIKRELEIKSEKQRSKTYRQFYGDIDIALQEGGLDENLMAELQSCQYPHDLLLETKKDIFVPIMYRTYRNLRHKGYSHLDLVTGN